METYSPLTPTPAREADVEACEGQVCVLASNSSQAVSPGKVADEEGGGHRLLQAAQDYCMGTRGRMLRDNGYRAAVCWDH